MRMAQETVIAYLRALWLARQGALGARGNLASEVPSKKRVIKSADTDLES